MKYTVDSFFNSKEKLGVMVDSLETKEILVREFDRKGYTLMDGGSWSNCRYRYSVGTSANSLCIANDKTYGGKWGYYSSGYTILTIDDFDIYKPTIKLTIKQIEKRLGIKHLEIVEEK